MKASRSDADTAAPSPGRFAPLQPWDDHNERLRRNAGPADWINPRPATCYNLVILGGGPAGLVAAAGAAGLGARVALIEKDLLGGDCLNVGCVPSKALIRAARAAAEVRRAAEFGVHVEGGIRVDFGAIMERMRRLRADLSPHDSAARFRDLGVDVFLGRGRFSGPETIEVAGHELRFAKAVIATGARAVVPPIAGLADADHLTNETLFSLTELPRRLGIIGAGPLGCEMAQCFARFGSEVFLIETAHGILPKEDRDAARIVRAALERDGVRILGDGRQLSVSRVGGAACLRLGGDAGAGDVAVDRLLIAAGRAPNIEDLGLELAGIAWDPQGVTVSDQLRTSNPLVYACGDVCSIQRFTHVADFQARIVIRNALFRGRAKASALRIPRCTYTSPEVAHIGLLEAEAAEQGIPVETYLQELARVDRAILDGETEGFVKVHVRRGTDRILGATVVATHAGELISELTLAMQGGLGLGTLGATVHPYPTQAEAIRRVGDLHARTRLTPFVRKAFERWLAWQRG